MIVSEIKLYELLKAKIGEKEAEALIATVEEKVNQKFEDNKSWIASKENIAELEVRINRSIYIVGLVQFVAIIGSVIAIIKFMM